MSKFNKIILSILSIFLMFSIISLSVFAATGETIITVIKEIIETHLYFIDDVEVSEEEYQKALQQTNTIIDEYTVEHHLYTNLVYKINGTEVSYTEYLAYFKTSSSTPSTITITGADLTSLNAGSLGDYLSFETDAYNNVISAIVKSNKVGSVIYKYSEDYLTFCDQDATGDYYFTAHCHGLLYQETSVSHNSLYFTIGYPATTNYFVCNKNGENTLDVKVGDGLFYFENNPCYSSIQFAQIFEAITLILK